MKFLIRLFLILSHYSKYPKHLNRVDVVDKSDADDFLADEAKQTKFTREEEKFIKSYYDGGIDKDYITEDAYYHTFEDPNSSDFYTPRQVQRPENPGQWKQRVRITSGIRN